MTIPILCVIVVVKMRTMERFEEIKGETEMGGGKGERKNKKKNPTIFGERMRDIVRSERSEDVIKADTTVALVCCSSTKIVKWVMSYLQPTIAWM